MLALVLVVLAQDPSWVTPEERYPATIEWSREKREGTQAVLLGKSDKPTERQAEVARGQMLIRCGSDVAVVKAEGMIKEGKDKLYFWKFDCSGNREERLREAQAKVKGKPQGPGPDLSTMPTVVEWSETERRGIITAPLVGMMAATEDQQSAAKLWMLSECVTADYVVEREGIEMAVDKKTRLWVWYFRCSGPAIAPKEAP